MKHLFSPNIFTPEARIDYVFRKGNINKKRFFYFAIDSSVNQLNSTRTSEA